MAKQRKQYPEDFKTMFGVSVMGLSQVVATGLISGYLMLHITDYAGIYTGVAGKAAQVATLMLLIGRIWDAVNDPLLGFVMDRSPRRKWGKFKPFIFWSTLASMVLIIALFNIPAGLPDVVKVALIYILYFVFDTAFTLAPASPLIQSLSRDADVRAKLLVAPRIVGLVLSTALSFFIAIAIALGPDGTTPNIGLAVVLFMVPLTALSLLGIALVKEGTHSADEEKASFSDVIAMIKANRPLLIALLALFAGGFVFNLTQVAGAYYMKYAFGAENFGRVSAIGGGIMIFSIILATVLSRFLLKWLTPGVCIILSYGTAAVALFVLWLINLGGPITSMLVFFPLLALAYLGNSSAYLPREVIIMECMDYNRFKTGKSLQGMTSALSGFIYKLQAAVGSALVGSVLVAVGYDAALYEDAATIPASLFSGLGLVYFALPTVFGVAAVAVMAFYPLLRKSARERVYADIEASNQAREEEHLATALA